MKREFFLGMGSIVCVAASAGTSAPLDRHAEIRNRDGKVIEILGSEGRPRDLPHVVKDPAIAELSPSTTLHRAEPANGAEACALPDQEDGRILRESRSRGLTVDACGRVRRDRDGALMPARRPAAIGSAAEARVTIDRMTTRLLSSASHSPGGTIALLHVADTYYLGDGTQWMSGAGSFVMHGAQLVRVETVGTTLRYVLSPPATELIHEQTDYDSGDHSAQGRLGAAGPLVIEAQTGSTTAVLRGTALVVSNDATWYGEPRFNYYSAVVGAVVPFEITYKILGDTWTAETFDRSFSYSAAGSVDFAHPISTPRAVELIISGSSRIPDESTVSYAATVRYDTGALLNVTADSAWSVEPSVTASVVGGMLTTGKLATPEVALTLRASIVDGPDTLLAEKRVRCLADDPLESVGSWPMFQGNARHTGYLPIEIKPAAFRLKWQRDLGAGVALNPVAAGEGKVFATLFTYFSDVTSLYALNAADGGTLWSKNFGSVFSVNPPSYAYGNVYVQTGNHGADTWLRAFDGATGATVFQSPHSAQWERYFAPTLSDGKAYVNGGSYGGMYGFDAFSGVQLWFTDLPQYDQWTPAVDGGRAYAYVGEYSPGLYTKDSLTGAPADHFVPDPNFEWNGWSMKLAPVIGNHDDVIAIHDGRLISFDPALGSIRWEVASAFAGQPSVAQDRIYAVDGGRLVVLDELTHAELWSWQAPEGAITGPMIVTKTHLLASTSGSVHAVDLVTRQSVWSFPVGGALAFADGTLYVASTDGKLSALTAASAYYPLAPCRVIDTRDGSGAPIGGPALVGGASRAFRIAGHCGVPSTAKAIAVNVTATQPGGAGHLSFSAPGGSAPAVSTVNYSSGQTRANNAIIGLDHAGETAALATQDPQRTVHLIVDVNGYFE